MNFEKFEKFDKNFVFNLQTENDNCIALLDNNKELIETKLGDPNNLKIIHKFVAFIKDAVLKKQWRICINTNYFVSQFNAECIL